MRIIGIDPGVTGAYAILEPDGVLLTVEDLPISEWGRAKWTDAQTLCSALFRWLEGKPARAVVEHTHAMPQMGTIAANSKGMTLGSVLAALQMAGIGFELVSPASWKNDLGLAGGKTDRDRKRLALQRARCLYPCDALEREKDHNRGEAILIAHWARERRARAHG